MPKGPCQANTPGARSGSLRGLVDQRLGSVSGDFAPLMVQVVRSLLGKPNQHLSTMQKLRFGNQGSLSVDLERGVWHDFEVGEGGGVLDLVERETRLTGRDAFEWLGRAVGAKPDIEMLRPRCQLSTRPSKSSPISQTLTSYWKSLWDSCAPIAVDDAAGIYLQTRGCALPPSDDGLRWYPTLRHPSGWTSPVLVALITDIHCGEPLSLLRTWIDPACPGKKAPLDRPRLLLNDHRKQGSAVRIWPDDTVTNGLLIAEGIETALAAARGFEPAWSLIDAGNLASFPVLPGIESLTVAVDHDGAGLRAWRALAKRWLAAGLEVRRWLPEDIGDDLNDHAVKVAGLA